LNKWVRNLLWIGLLVMVVVIFQFAQGGVFRPRRADIPYSTLYTYAANGSVQSVEINRNVMTGRLKPEAGTVRAFKAIVPDSPWTQEVLLAKLREKGATIKVNSPWFSEGIVSILLQLLFPFLIFGFIWMMFIRQAQSTGNQALSFGRSRAKRLTDNVPKVTFDDVAGVDEAKTELQEVVEFLKNPKKFQALGAKIPKGVLLLGPPGCGKTLLARAIAGEAGVPFFHISGSDFVEMFVGVGASRVRDLFDTAKANKPSLVFIDEIDAVGRQRGTGLGGGHDEREQTLNQLLVEMDGFDPNSGVILIAATNRPDVLDPALLRPGRFDRRVVVDNPDQNGRRMILSVHVKGKPLADDVSLDNLAKRTPGFSGADLANLVNEAALLAARKEQTKITMADFDASIDRVVAGPERKSRLIGDREKLVVAYHEVGHAIMMELLPHSDPMHKVTILPRGMALGLTWSLPQEDRYLVSRNQILDDIAGLLGGRVAEEIHFGEIWTGASNDLDRATDLARRMVMEYGMSERLGPRKLGERHGNPFLGRDAFEDRNYSEDVARAIDEEVRRIIDEAYERARQILKTNEETMDRIVQVLLERETIDREEFLALMRGETTLPKKETPPPTADTPSGTPEPTDDRPRRPVAQPRLNPGPA
jgi:cell division protease FtsH